MEDRATRVVETVWLFWAFHFVGFVNGILGPTLLDLKEIVRSSMEEMSYIFFVRGAGFVVGVVLSYVLEQCMSTRLILTCSLLIGCTVQFALPYGTVFYCLAVAFFIMGVTAGIINNVTISICNKLWPEKKGVPFQFVVVGSGIGSFLAPFLATPFLANTDSSDDDLWITNTTIADHLRSYVNGTQSHTPLDQSRVQYVYMIAGLICVPPVFAFTYYHWKRKSNPLINYENIQQTDKQLYSLRTVIFIALLCFYHITVRGVVLAYGDLLTPYGVDVGLHLSKFRMAMMTSIFWGCFLLGKILNLLLSDFFQISSSLV
ncbi:sodium-dependent glucose transporter 1-like [Haliotis rubra]|uniref:sodium-dependent glucose transporter 1-like n=1 Tax=Haliotis rubra TaxID=36100 RepID=UPI001EE623EA|nr:sodium-dependent glucose transporter 1-like [Haliotis rubra]